MPPPPLIHPRHPLSLATKIASIRSSLTPFSLATIAIAAHPLRIRIKASNTRIILTTTTASSHTPFFLFPSTHCLPHTNNSNYSILSRTMTTLNQRQKEAATMPTYPEYRSLVPPLSASLYKGQGGRVCVLGGSSDYTGAPYFSAMSALRLGADLSHVICDEDAATAIKSYSPDLIVHPYIKIRAANAAQDKKTSNDIWAHTFDEINSVLKRIHVLVVGPGLSRDKGMLQTAKHAIEVAREQGMPIVIDADGLFLIQNEPEIIRGYKKAVLTPNLVEFGRLCNAMNVDTEDEEAELPAVQRLSQALEGVIIIQKGKFDVISDGQKVQVVDSEGGLKRSGGQGDILTGLVATSLAWGLAYEKEVWQHTHPVKKEDVAMTACFGACVISRECSRLAFEKHKRALQSSDVLAEIGPFFHLFYQKPRQKATWAEAIYG